MWASAEGMHGFVSIDVSPELLPPDAEGKGMAFVGRASLPNVSEAARGLVEAADPLTLI